MAARFAAIIVGTKVYGNADLQHVARPLPETFAVDLGVMRLDWPSFGLGLIVAAIWQLLRRRKSRWRMLAKVLMVAALVAGLDTWVLAEAETAALLRR